VAQSLSLFKKIIANDQNEYTSDYNLLPVGKESQIAKFNVDANEPKDE